MTIDWKKLTERLSWQTGRLSEIALQSIAFGLLAMLIYTEVIPRSIVPRPDRILFTLPLLAVAGLVVIVCRMIAGDKWS